MQKGPPAHDHALGRTFGFGSGKTPYYFGFVCPCRGAITKAGRLFGSLNVGSPNSVSPCFTSARSPLGPDQCFRTLGVTRETC
jgi:hypothetical protein